MQTIKITTSQNIDIDYEVAGLGERILARMIDIGIAILIIILGSIILSIINTSEIVNLVFAIIYGALLGFYDLVFEVFMDGQSIGKRIMKIKVISLDGAQPRFSQYLLRWLFRIVDFLLIEPGLVALVTAAVCAKPQRLGDIVAGTILIRTNPRTKIDNIAFSPVYDGYQPVFNVAGQLRDKDIELIHEVINNYVKTGNSTVVYNMAQRIKEHLNIAPPNGMNNMLFLQTIINDYNHLSSQVDGIIAPIAPPVYQGYQPVFTEAEQLKTKDIALVKEVINAAAKNDNPVLIYNMAQRIKAHLNITPPANMDDTTFLQTIIKDYNHISTQVGSL